jgi:hypothetical protein
MPDQGDGEMPATNGNTNAIQQGQGGTGTTDAEQQNQQGAAGQQAQQQVPANFESWLKEKGGEEGQALYQQHIAGLQNTVTATRKERDDLTRRVAEIKKTLGTDPEKAKSEMDRLTTEIQDANRRIEFLEEAGKPGTECLNASAAWLVAQAGNLFRANGSPDWKAVREAAPQLFGKPALEIGAGAGTGNGNRGGPSTMDDRIRARLNS